MSLKHNIAFYFFTLTVIYSPSQINYLGVDYSRFALKLKSDETFSNVPRGTVIRFNGTYLGESFQLGLGQYCSFGLGLGLTKIDYEKQWLGTFPGNNKFGNASLNGKIQYLSFPISLTLITGAGTSGSLATRRGAVRSRITITYVPSFLTANSFSLSTQAAADSTSYFSAYNLVARGFQHTFTIGLCNQFFFFDKHVRLSIEPYLGWGSRYFNLNEHSFTITYGVKLGLHFRLPRIIVERQTNRGNTDEKKQLLIQKQKEIKEQLNKQP